MSLTLGELATVSLLAYSLAFIVIGIITVLPMAIVRGGKKPVTQAPPPSVPETKPEVQREETPIELIAIAAAVAVHSAKSKRLTISRAVELPERAKWLLRSRIDVLSLRKFDLSYTRKLRG